MEQSSPPEERVEQPRTTSRSWLQQSLLGVLFSTIALGAFYFLYVVDQQALQSRYLFHVLSKSGEDVGQALITRRDNIKRAFENLEEENVADSSPDAETAVSEPSNAADEPADAPDCKRDASETEQVVSTIIRRLLLIPDVDNSDIQVLSPESICGKPVDTTMEIDRGLQFLRYQVFDKSGLSDYKTRRAENGQTAADMPRPLVTVETDIKELLLPWVSREGLLENIFVARKNGEVLVNKGLGSLALVTLPQEPESSKDDGPTTEAVGRAGASVRTVEIAGEQYKLFLQPFRVPGAITVAPDSRHADKGHATGERDTEWLVGGLVSNAAFRSRTMAVPPTLIIAVFTAVVVLLLMVPFLRVRLIGEREGLHARDVLMLALTMLLGCSLASVAATHVRAYWQERERRKTELQEIADVIESRLSNELNALEETLVAINSLDWSSKIQPDLLADDSWKYPHFEMVFGIDEEGQQKWKGSIRSSTTPLLQLADREYFQRARNHDLWPSSHRLPGRFVESIRSKTTGEEYAILSGRLDGAENTTVAAIESRLLSLIDPLLLPPYQFCVIDTDGNVQFHSNRQRNLTENLFDSLGSNWELKAAVQRGASRHFAAAYRANPIAAYVTPLSGTPWMLIVFGDRRDLGYMHLETLSLTLIVVAFYLTMLFVVSGGLLWFLTMTVDSSRSPPGATRSMWYWPNPSMQHLYGVLLVLLLFAAVAWAIGTLGDFRWMPICCFAGPIAISVVIGSVLVGIGRSRLTRKRSVDITGPWPWTYKPLVVGLLVTIGVLPPINFYTAIHKAEAAAFEDRRKLDLADRLRGRVEHHVDRFHQVKLSKTNAERLRSTLALRHDSNSSVADALDVHLPPGWRVEQREESKAEEGLISARPRKRPQRFGRWLGSADELVGYYGRTFGRMTPTPNYDEYVAESRGLIARNSDRLSWPDLQRRTLVVKDWRPSVLRLGLGNAGNDAKPPQSLQLEVSGLPVTESPSVGKDLVLIAAFVTAAIIFLLLVCPILQMVFIRDLKHPKWIDGEDLLETRPSGFARQLRLRFPRQSDSAGDGDSLTIDYRAVSQAESAADLAKKVHPEIGAGGPEREIRLAHFDYGLDDPDIRQKKLELLQYLLTQGHRVVIDSSIEPMFFLTAQVHDPWLRAEIPLGRWATALQQFTTLRARKDETLIRDRGEKLKKLRDEQPDMAWSGLSEEVQDVLISEGWFDSHLEVIAATLCGRKELEDYSAEDVLEQFEDAAGAHYRRIWSTCSTDEKVLLHRLAQGDFVNWRMKHTVTSLMRRRLIIAAPDYRLMNESFRRFVLGAEPADVVRQWEQAAGPSTWTRLRGPAVLFLIFVALFFIVTQRDVAVQVLSVVTMLTAGAPSLVRLVSLVMNGRAPSSP